MFKKVNESNIYEIELSTFLDNQKKIMEKYKGKLEKNTRMEIIDKYLLQTMEEVWESENESNDVSQLYEKIDVLMYLGSLYAVVTDCDDAVIKHDNRYFTIVNIYDPEAPFKVKQVSDSLISLRRLMPERKWHKPHNNKLEEINIISADIVMNLIKNMINLIIYDEYQINKNKNTSTEIANRYIKIKEENFLK